VPKSGGSHIAGGVWHKESDTPNTGFHWQGSSEPALVLVKAGSGRCYRNPKAMVNNGYTSRRGRHSRKDPQWQADCIKRWVPKGGRVLDLYAGLGSVAEAVILAAEDRRYVGAEIDPQRYEDARGLIHHNTAVRL
jgi:hypothetical protein